MSTGYQFYFMPSMFPFVLPRSLKGKQCLTRCVSGGGDTVIHPLNGRLKVTSVNAECAVKRFKDTKGNKKYFDKCMFQTRQFDPWLSVGLNTLMFGSGDPFVDTPRSGKQRGGGRTNSTLKHFYRAILASNYKIFSRKEGVVWLNTRATDATLSTQVRVLLHLAYPSKKHRLQ